MKTRWHPEEIKCAVRMRGTTLTALALSRDLPEAACRLALIRRHRAGEAAIAKFLGVSVQELWPDRYDGEGRPVHIRSGKQPIKSTTRRPRQKREER